MARSSRSRYETERQAIQERGRDGRISEPEAEAIVEFLDAKDPETIAVNDPVDDSTKSDSTLKNYAFDLKRLAELTEFDLTDTTADELNAFMDQLRAGTVEGVKDEGLSAGSIKNYQGTLRKFYEYHTEFAIEKQAITLLNPDSSSVDERDIFEKEDIQALRNATQHPRDKALIDMLLYTGQRLSALLNLRLKDMKPEEGIFYLNEEAGDLKGATGKRPLLLAEKAARDWKNQHPCDDPEAHFITHKHNWENREYGAGDRLDNSTIHRQLARIGKRAGVEKPVNAHNFRHTFVTVAKRNYGMDNDTIKRLIGHRPDSNIMESTYAHLTDDDVIAEAERKVGKRDDEPESPLTPERCGNCGEPVPMDNAKACMSCGITFTPDAKAAKDKLKGEVREEKDEAKTLEEYKDADAIAQALEDDPKLAAQLMEKLGELSE